jgi:hypothetical protein
MAYSEICTILFLKNKNKILNSEKIQISKLNLIKNDLKL